MPYTNSTNIHPLVGVWLAHDDYDGKTEENHISVTSLIKPIRQLVLMDRVPELIYDISTQVASKVGSAVHKDIENTWCKHYKESLLTLGYPQSYIDRIKINPSEVDLVTCPNVSPIYFEQRVYKEIEGMTLNGQYDCVMDGEVRDIKKTKVFNYKKALTKDTNKLQGSIYRFLNPKIITSDIMYNDYILLDWQKSLTRSPDYPQSETISHRLEAYPLEYTENYIREKIKLFKSLRDVPESELPQCTDEDLWRDEVIWKYYKDPTKRSRSTKNFSDAQSAAERLHKDGHVGVVVEVKPKAKACLYCAGFTICSQKDELIAAGHL